jgi:hypothetical protein
MTRHKRIPAITEVIREQRQRQQIDAGRDRIAERQRDPPPDPLKREEDTPDRDDQTEHGDDDDDAA